MILFVQERACQMVIGTFEETDLARPASRDLLLRPATKAMRSGLAGRTPAALMCMPWTPSSRNDNPTRHNSLEQTQPTKADEHFTAGIQQRPGCREDPFPMRFMAKGGDCSDASGMVGSINRCTAAAFELGICIHTNLTREPVGSSSLSGGTSVPSLVSLLVFLKKGKGAVPPKIPM
jgi:hypothetical protein